MGAMGCGGAHPGPTAASGALSLKVHTQSNAAESTLSSQFPPHPMKTLSSTNLPWDKGLLSREAWTWCRCWGARDLGWLHGAALGGPCVVFSPPGWLGEAGGQPGGDVHCAFHHHSSFPDWDQCQQPRGVPIAQRALRMCCDTARP